MTKAAASARAPFEWADGPLVTAMRQGDIILIDELNLAEDAVLERLNRSATVLGPHFNVLLSHATLICLTHATNSFLILTCA